MKVFVDTSAFCALTIPIDQHNPKAKALYNRLKEQEPLFYTSDYVLDEVYTLLKTRASHRTSIKFMEQISKSRLVLLRISDAVEEQAKDIFRRFDDKKLSFTDCTSFALINQYGIETVFAFDKHFSHHPYTQAVEHLGPE